MGRIPQGRVHGADAVVQKAEPSSHAGVAPVGALPFCWTRQLLDATWGERNLSVILVTGANKGLGYETARQLIGRGHAVYVGSRSVERGVTAASELGGQFVQIDVTDETSVETALGVIDEREGHLDVLINNAGISTTAEVNGSEALKVFDTNAIGLIRVTQTARPLLVKSENPVVVNVSSALGSF
jgi:NAD(P)-dependent dehydrogenase (short-subunit alcohol dehydrogenase family)